MGWSKINKAPLIKSERIDTPDGLWFRCSGCTEIIYRHNFEANHNVCPRCHLHHPISPENRFKLLLDPKSYKEVDTKISPTDPLKFSDSKDYSTRISTSQKKTGAQDAFLSATGTIFGIDVQVGGFDFRFMGGSMGSVVGEKIARVFLRAAENFQPAIIISSSGGARMQEGILSLMQMAKTCAALSRLKDSGIPMISVLTNPTTGGVAASYAMLGDVNIAEPKALIGFAGPRVIQQTIGQSLPEGFQTAEYLLEHGMLDQIVERVKMRSTLGVMLNILTRGIPTKNSKQNNQRKSKTTKKQTQ